jgi:class 3 adenylate cyclase/putative methionine-R-sulfoxide reductase with GAF domain
MKQSKAAKVRRRRIVAPKRRKAPKAACRAGLSAASQETEVARLTRELHEALEQQRATSDVLQVISRSPNNLQPVFDTILESSTRICGTKVGVLFRYEDDAYTAVAQIGVPPEFTAFMARGPIRPGPLTGLGRIIETKQTVQIVDTRAEQAYADREPWRVATAELAGVRSLLNVPMLKDGELMGAIGIYRQEVNPFSEEQVALVTNFAAQAVIAIENTRLLSELREALERQTAASVVLQVISSSPGELGPVFSALLANATRICSANFGNMFLYESEAFRAVAMHNAPGAYAKARASPIRRPPPSSGLGRLVATKRVVHIADLMAEPAYINGDPFFVSGVKLAGIRTLLAVPMLKEGELLGAIVIFRREVRPFTAKQIELMHNFAAQAVIAIENTRLLNELRERTGELERSYGLVQHQASQLEAHSQELFKLNQQLEQRVAEQVGEIRRMGRLRRFLPPQVADLIVSSGTEKQLDSHRREITALFCDLRGFTGFSESSDPEDVMALLREYHAAIGEIIIKYSGTLERFAGDGVMVVFNDPVPVTNPALQAVQMALDMRAAIGLLIEKWRRLGHDLGFGIGIAHGFATLGTIGFEGRFDYAAIGTVSNVASRLCDEAKPSQILISPRVLMAVEEAVTVEPVGEFTLKGIRRPMMAHNVLGGSPST